MFPTDIKKNWFLSSPAVHAGSGSQTKGCTKETECRSLLEDVPHTFNFGEVLPEVVVTDVTDLLLFCGDVKRTPRKRHIRVPTAI